MGMLRTRARQEQQAESRHYTVLDAAVVAVVDMDLTKNAAVSKAPTARTLVTTPRTVSMLLSRRMTSVDTERVNARPPASVVVTFIVTTSPGNRSSNAAPTRTSLLRK